MRYALIFRLNRPNPTWPRRPGDTDGAPPLPEGAKDAVGNLSFAGFTFDWDNSIFDFDAQSLTRDLPDVDNCFIGAIRDSTGFAASFFDGLDAIPDGGRVRVRLRPLTPRPDGTPMYGRVYVRHPRIVPAHVTGTLYLTVTNPAALAALRSTGCAGTILY